MFFVLIGALLLAGGQAAAQNWSCSHPEQTRRVLVLNEENLPVTTGLVVPGNGDQAGWHGGLAADGSATFCLPITAFNQVAVRAPGFRPTVVNIDSHSAWPLTMHLQHAAESPDGPKNLEILVQDPTDAMVPGATVTLHRKDGTTATSKTNGEGVAVLQLAQSEAQSVDVAAPGFQTARVVVSGKEPGLTVRLKIGPTAVLYLCFSRRRLSGQTSIRPDYRRL